MKGFNTLGFVYVDEQTFVPVSNIAKVMPTIEQFEDGRKAAARIDLHSGGYMLSTWTESKIFDHLCELAGDPDGGQ